MKNYQENKQDPIKVGTNSTAKLLTAVYKWIMLKFKLDEDPLQHQIYFFTLIELLEIISAHYKETREILLDHPTIGGEDIIKKSLRNLLYANIDVHSRRFIDELPRDGVKLISILQSHCANKNSSDKVDMIVSSSKLHIKEESKQLITSIYSTIHRIY